MNLLPRRGLAMLILLCLLLGGVGVRFYQTQLQQAESRAREQLLSVARLKVERIAAWRRERMDDGRLLNANRLLLAGFRDWLNGTADPAVRGDLTAVFEALQRNYGYRDYLLVDAAGRVRLQSGAPSAVALEAEAQAALAAVQRSREPSLTEVHIDAAFPYPHISLVVPLWQGEAPAGALILVMDARQTLFPLLTTWPVPSTTAETLLVRRDGDDLVFLNELRHQPDSALRLRLPLTRVELPAVQAILGQTGVVAGRDYRGEAVLAAVLPVPDTPWLHSAKMDRREIHAGARREAMLAGGGLLAVLALTVALVALAWQRRLREQTQWRLRAQTAERESLERFRNLFEQSQDGILLLSPDFRVLDANPAAQALLGYAHAALLGMRLPDLLAPEELPRIAPAVDQIMAGEPHRGEWRQRRADGATFLAQVTAQRLDAECYYATLRDITRQRELETAQAETTRRLQLILNEATDGLWDWNIRTGEDFHAPRYWEMLGYDPDERPAIDTAAVFEALVHPDDLPRVHTALQAHLERREPYQVELRLRTKSGDYRWFVTRGQAEWDADDQPLRMAGFITDISGRKAAEEALQASEARLDYALTQSHTGAWTMNLDDHTAQHTLEHDRLFGYAAPQTHWTYERFLEHVVPEERDAVDSQFRAAVSQKTAILFVCRIRRTDGEIRWFQVNGEYQPPKDGGAPRFSGIVRDITEAKALEQSLRAELALREQLQQTSENVPGVIYTFRYGPDGRMSMPYASAKLLDLTGYPPEAVTDDVGPLLDLIHPEDAERVRASIEASAQHLTLWGETFRLSHPVRGEVWIEGNSSPSRAADGSIYWHGFMSDITERKANERMLRLTQFAMENAVDEVYYIRQDGRFQYVNDAACRALEYRREELLTMTVPEVDPLFSEETWREHWRILKAEGSRTLETLHRSRSGRVYPVEIHVNFIEHEGQEYSCSICRDISERKQAERALHDSNDRYDELVRRIPAGVYTLRLHAGTPRFEYVSGKLLQMLGLDETDAWQDPAVVFAGVHPLDRSGFDAANQQAIEGLAPYRWEGRHQVRGETHWFRAASDPMRGADGDYRWNGVVIDISEQKRAEQALRDSEFRWKFAIEGIDDGLWDWDLVSNTCFFSPRWKTMIGHAEDEIGTSPDEWVRRVHPEDWNQVQATWQAHLDGTLPQHVVEYRLRHKDGSWIWILGRGQVCERDANGQPLRVIGTHTDITARKRMEAELVELNEQLEHRVNERTAELQRMSERLDLAMQVTSDGVWDCNLQTRKVYCNANYFAMLGYGPDELGDDLDHVFTDLLHPEERAAVVENVRRRFQEEGGHMSEFRMRTKDGEYRWIFARGRVIERGTEGQPMRAIGTHVDITARKEAEAALRALSNYSRRLIEASLDPLVTISPEGLIQDVNTATERVTGYSREQLIGSDFSRYFTEPDQARAGYQQVFAEGFVTDYPLAIRHADGHVTDVLYNASVYRNDAGEVTGVFAAARDVTERRRQEQALRESEARFRHMADAAPVLIWMAGLDKLCHYFNRIWLEFTGRTLEQEFGNGWFEGVHADDAAACMNTYLESFEARRPFSMEYRLRRHDGEYRWLRDDGAPRFDGAGQFLGYIGSCIDITERKAAEQAVLELNASLERKVAERTAQLAEAKTAAEAATRSKSEFLANMSHEIRTPMNAILGLTQLLEREPLTPDQRDLLGKISDAGHGLLHIINDILDFSKIEAGQLKVERLPFELPPVLSLLETLMTGSAEGKGLGLRIEPPAGLDGPILGDPLRLKQILLNLVSNAIKFTDRGAVTVRVLPLALTATAARLRFEVSDTGIGIAPEALARLFQPFTQADASTTRRFGGTGLGLSICKRLVELMGGTIGATSEPGAGSTFWFELPCERAAAALAEAPAASAADGNTAPTTGPRLQGLRVLGVDDNRMNLFLLERALKLEGASVLLAADGQQALQILEANPRGVDCVLMDIQMPVMDGLTATRRIREQAELRNLPVIALTAGVMAEERDRALAAGVDDFLAKPLVLETMVAMLRPYLPAGEGSN